MELNQISGSMAFKFGHVPRHAVIRMTGTPELKSRNRMFIAGMGFVGQVLAQDLKNRGWAVSGTCTGSIKKKKLEEERGFDIYLFDANQPDVTSTLDVIKDHTHLLVSIPPVPAIGDPMLQNELLLRRALMGGNLQWLCYLSSTSVYGDSGGAWVDEEQVYNIVDDEPAPREEVFEYARDLVEKKLPGWIKHSSEQKDFSVVVKKESLLGEESFQCSNEERVRCEASSSKL